MPTRIGSGEYPVEIKHIILDGVEVKKMFLDGVEVFPSYAESETFTVTVICEAKIWEHVQPQYGDEYYLIGYRWSVTHSSAVTRRIETVDIAPGETRVFHNTGYTNYDRAVKVYSPFTRVVDVPSLSWVHPDKYGDPDNGYYEHATPEFQWTINCLDESSLYKTVSGTCVFTKHQDGDPDHFNVYMKVEILNIRTTGTFGQPGSYCCYDIKTSISHTADDSLTFDYGSEHFVVHEDQHNFTITNSDLYWFWYQDTPQTKSTYDLRCWVPHKNDSGQTTMQTIFNAVSYGMTEPTDPRTIFEQTKNIDYIT